MAYQGMDVDAVERTARSIKDAAAEAGRVRQGIDSSVRSLASTWLGEDYRQFLGGQWKQSAAQLRTLERELNDYAAVLERNVRAQREVSSAKDGASSGGGAAGPKNSPGGPPMERPGSPKNSTNPQVVADWWKSLTPGERKAMIAAYPELIGAANGVTAEARDQANRFLLNRDLDGVVQRHAERVRNGTFNPLSPTHRAELEIAENALAIDKALRSIPDGEGFLLAYDPRAYGNDGTVAISVGNPDTADNVTSYVPGLDAQVDTASDGVTRASELYKAAGQVSPGSKNAVIYALVYDTPSGGPITSALNDHNTVAGTGRAKEGSEMVANFVNGLKSSRGDDQPHMSVIGHSYGSTTVSYAFTEHNLKVDDVILIGSPGAGDAKTAADFGEAKVWSGSNSRDVVSAIGQGKPLGTDPSSDSFKATRFQAEAVDRGVLRDTGNHSKYFNADSESLANMARIVTGHDQSVNTAGQRSMSWTGMVDPEVARTPRTESPAN